MNSTRKTSGTLSKGVQMKLSSDSAENSLKERSEKYEKMLIQNAELTEKMKSLTDQNSNLKNEHVQVCNNYQNQISELKDKCEKIGEQEKIFNQEQINFNKAQNQITNLQEKIFTLEQNCICALHKKQISESVKNSDSLCMKCGGSKHRHENKCPAFGKNCLACGKVNHFARVCDSFDSSVILRQLENYKKLHKELLKDNKECKKTIDAQLKQISKLEIESGNHIKEKSDYKNIAEYSQSQISVFQEKITMLEKEKSNLLLIVEHANLNGQISEIAET